MPARLLLLPPAAGGILRMKKPQVSLMDAGLHCGPWTTIISSSYWSYRRISWIDTDKGLLTRWWSEVPRYYTHLEHYCFPWRWKRDFSLVMLELVAARLWFGKRGPWKLDLSVAWRLGKGLRDSPHPRSSIVTVVFAPSGKLLRCEHLQIIHPLRSSGPAKRPCPSLSQQARESLLQREVGSIPPRSQAEPCQNKASTRLLIPTTVLPGSCSSHIHLYEEGCGNAFGSFLS